jgi:hypothetical protein
LNSNSRLLGKTGEVLQGFLFLGEHIGFDPTNISMEIWSSPWVQIRERGKPGITSLDFCKKSKLRIEGNVTKNKSLNSLWL